MKEVKDYPLYECHKKVRAIKIESIELDKGFCYLKPEDKSFDEIKLTIGWYIKVKPGAGGYYIEEPNGAKSYMNEQDFKRDFDKIK